MLVEKEDFRQLLLDLGFMRSKPDNSNELIYLGDLGKKFPDSYIFFAGSYPTGHDPALFVYDATAAEIDLTDFFNKALEKKEARRITQQYGG